MSRLKKLLQRKARSSRTTLPVQSATTPVQNDTTPITRLTTSEQSAAVTLENGSTEPSTAAPSIDPGDEQQESSSHRSSFAQLHLKNKKIVNLKLVHQPSTESIVVDIVFVHGLFGDAVRTWYHDSSRYYWPDLLKEDISNARIFTFGYDADIISFAGGVSMDRLAVHASNLVGELHRVRKSELQKTRKIIFIAHSLGGLVVKRAIQDSADSSVTKLRGVEEATAGIVFLGTPHSGSDLATFATAIGSLLKFVRKRVNDDLLNVLQRDFPILLDLEKWFGHWLRKRTHSSADGRSVEVICFTEAKQLPGGKKVVEDSQAILSGYPSYSIPTNHMDMTKVNQEGKGDVGYVRVLSELEDWIQEWTTAPSALPGFCKDVLSWLLTKLLRQNTSVWTTLIELAAVIPVFRDSTRVNRLLKRLAEHSCPYEDRKNIIETPLKGTCKWFMNHHNFQQWIEGETPGLLWVSADPGCGKSVLARYLADEVLPCSGRTVCYFSFKDGFTDQMPIASALCALIRQLVQQNRRLITEELLDQFDQNPDGYYKSIQSLWKSFLTIATMPTAGEVICVLDALDESSESDLRHWTAEVQQQFQNHTNPRLKFLFTSRPYQRIQWQFQEFENRFPNIHLRGENQREHDQIIQEVDRVIDHKVTSLGERRRLVPDEYQHLKKLVKANPNRTYLWATLVLDIIDLMPELSPGKLTETFNHLPSKVEDAYESMLKKSANESRARKALELVLAARKPLTIHQMRDALTTEGRHESLEALCKDLEPLDRFKDTLKDVSGLLLIFRSRKRYPRSSDFYRKFGFHPEGGSVNSRQDSCESGLVEEVHLLHQTVRDFLIKPQSMNLVVPSTTLGSSWKHSFSMPSAHRTFAATCFMYLSITVKADEEKYRIPHGRSSFEYYTSKNWTIHFDESDITTDEPITKEVATFCEQLYTFNTATRRRLLKATRSMIGNELGLTEGSVAPLIVATYFGCEKLVLHYISFCQVDMNETDYDGRTALHWAAENNDACLVRLLLSNDTTEVDLADKYGDTPLRLSFATGWVNIVALLCTTGKVDTNGRYQLGNSYLWHSVDALRADYWRSVSGERTEIGMIKSLLRAEELDTNAPRPHGDTPLMHIASFGLVELARLLLSHKTTDINKTDDNGDTALIWAIRSDSRYQPRGDMVRLILAHSKADSRNEQALFLKSLNRAVELGRTQMLSILKESDMFRTVDAARTLTFA